MSSSSTRSASAASRISGVWNAPPTFSAVARFTPSSLARAEPASTPSGVPAITTCPGALSFATQHASGAAVHASSACSTVAPSSAAMRPGCASAAACVSSARRAANRTPSSSESAPAAMRAVTWPSEWPANATGASTWSRTASHATREVRRTASCASRVRASASGGASSTSGASGSPSASSACSTTLPRRVVTPGRAHAALLGALAGEDDSKGHEVIPNSALRVRWVRRTRRVVRGSASDLRRHCSVTSPGRSRANGV